MRSDAAVWAVGFVAIIGLAGLGNLTRGPSAPSASVSAGAWSATPTMAIASGTGDCDIKGNVSPETGERIYHVPGQKYYAKTRISPGKGERWFCSEAEARAAGWRRAKV